MHRFRCYDNIHVCKLITVYTVNVYSAEREMSASACTRCMARQSCYVSTRNKKEVLCNKVIYVSVLMYKRVSCQTSPA